MAEIAETIQGLDAEKHRSFMYIEGLSNLYEYSNPTLSSGVTWRRIGNSMVWTWSN